jgi:hypothetical protein
MLARVRTQYNTRSFFVFRISASNSANTPAPKTGRFKERLCSVEAIISCPSSICSVVIVADWASRDVNEADEWTAAAAAATPVPGCSVSAEDAAVFARSGREGDRPSFVACEYAVVKHA